MLQLSRARMIDRARFQAMSDIAESKVSALADKAAAMYKRQYREFADLYREGVSVKKAIARFQPKWQDDSIQLKALPALRMAVDGYRTGEALLGKKQAVAEMRAVVAAYDAKVISPAEIWSDIDDLIAVHMKPGITVWLKETSKIETVTTCAQIETRIQRAIKFYDDAGQGTNIEKIAKGLIQDGVADSPARAKLLARTTTVWTHNAGAMESYKDAGFSESEWMVTLDDATCEYCEQFDGKIETIGNTFASSGTVLIGTDTGRELTVGMSVEWPPLHPHCRCTIVPSG